MISQLYKIIPRRRRRELRHIVFLGPDCGQVLAAGRNDKPQFAAATQATHLSRKNNARLQDRKKAEVGPLLLEAAASEPPVKEGAAFGEPVVVGPAVAVAVVEVAVALEEAVANAAAPADADADAVAVAAVVGEAVANLAPVDCADKGAGPGPEVEAVAGVWPLPVAFPHASFLLGAVPLLVAVYSLLPGASVESCPPPVLAAPSAAAPVPVLAAPSAAVAVAGSRPAAAPVALLDRRGEKRER